MKTLYVIPGYGETTKDAGYSEIIKFAKKNKYRVYEINPTWKRKTIRDWITNFEKEIASHDVTNATVVGFSFGAYIAAIAKMSFSRYFFCSLSPYFSEDIPKLPKIAYKILGKKRIKDFSLHDFRSRESEAFFLVGDKEHPIVKLRAEKSYKKWKGRKKFVLIPGTDHDISKKHYIESVIKYLAK